MSQLLMQLTLISDLSATNGALYIGANARRVVVAVRSTASLKMSATALESILAGQSMESIIAHPSVLLSFPARILAAFGGVRAIQMGLVYIPKHIANLVGRAIKALATTPVQIAKSI